MNIWPTFYYDLLGYQSGFLRNKAKLLKKMKLMVFITEKPSSLAWSRVWAVSLKALPLCPSSALLDIGLTFTLRGSYVEATGSSTHILATKQSHGKGTVLYKSSLKFPGRLSMDNSSYMPNHIQVHRPGLGLCSQEPGRSSVLYKYRRQRSVLQWKTGMEGLPWWPIG